MFLQKRVFCFTMRGQQNCWTNHSSSVLLNENLKLLNGIQRRNHLLQQGSRFKPLLNFGFDSRRESQRNLRSRILVIEDAKGLLKHKKSPTIIHQTCGFLLAAKRAECCWIKLKDINLKIWESLLMTKRNCSLNGGRVYYKNTETDKHAWKCCCAHKKSREIFMYCLKYWA